MSQNHCMYAYHLNTSDTGSAIVITITLVGAASILCKIIGIPESMLLNTESMLMNGTQSVVMSTTKSVADKTMIMDAVMNAMMTAVESIMKIAMMIAMMDAVKIAANTESVAKIKDVESVILGGCSPPRIGYGY